MSASRLSTLQRSVLDAFFARETLTGGAALAGFHLGHRTTHDLDLFASTDRLEQGAAVLSAVAQALGATRESLRTGPHLRRFLVRTSEEGIVVDLVHDPTPQGSSAKMNFGRIRVDPPEEILANKLCALLSRSEPRDLVDVLALERAGYRVDDALPVAMRKDAGLTPAQLAWVLSRFPLAEDTPSPGGTTVAELRRYLGELQARLTRLAHP